MSFCYGDIHGPSWKRHNPAPPPTTTEEGENSSKAHYQDKRISVSLTNQDLGDAWETTVCHSKWDSSEFRTKLENELRGNGPPAVTNAKDGSQHLILYRSRHISLTSKVQKGRSPAQIGLDMLVHLNRVRDHVCTDSYQGHVVSVDPTLF
ncbi:uncharacterized protein BKA55DRAFT_546242 [Fusarium redolens]|uniref:Uncharacterized protein n=1 Tax=Fusarium redolens TaxID=48865 RepID=A0A9P9FXS9_FUSRE|nr:uncharacterized protein BKA55DRAFT_546242 [Fusarium redolens]KAH7220461.1 hypothetical protein BKA55DRAFT_546242 [Fusarium redolens]